MEDGIVRRTHVDLGSAASAGSLAPSPWAPGAEFSRYQIDSRLAGGGMAEVWRAKVKGAAGFEKRIVIKTMQTQLANRPDLVEMFVGEAAIAALLSHPNIVHVFDFGQIEGRYFMAMEYVPGVTLRFAHKRALARGQRLPIATALHVLVDVCEALHHLHEIADEGGCLGLVHRDLSPDNVILSTSGSAKLIDFGAARATARTPPTPIFVGKYRYAAPERIRHEDEDRRSDVYSAGVILYECLAGVRPFEGSDADVMQAAVSSAACDPRDRVPELPAGVAEVVLKATAQDPARRFATARELGAALGVCLAELGAFSKEHDVTAALAALLDAPSETPSSLEAPALAISATPPTREAVPEVIEVDPRSAEDFGPPEPPSDAEIALCEVEILEASGPIRLAGGPPLPPPAVRPSFAVAPPPPPLPMATTPVVRGPSASGQAVLGWRTGPSQPPPAGQRSALQRAVELFDRGLELRAAGHYGVALDAWEKALRLAPENRVYQSNVARLREQLTLLRAESAAFPGAAPS